jgi:hypothetical protein
MVRNQKQKKPFRINYVSAVIPNPEKGAGYAVKK